MNSKYKFSENEYLSIRSELIDRIKMMYSQDYTALIAILSTWTVGITFKITVFSNNFHIQDGLEDILLRFLSTIIFIIPIIFFMPLAIKSGENLIQIASLSSYIRVFYDYPIKVETKNKNWETSNNLLSNANVNRKNSNPLIKFFNGEYTILSLLSFTLLLTFSFLDITNLFRHYDNHKIGKYTVLNIILLYIFIIILALAIIITIYKSSNIKNTLMKYTVYYTNGYINRAHELGLITDQQLANAIYELNPLREMEIKNFFN